MITSPPAFPQNDAAVNRINNESGLTQRQYAAIEMMKSLVSNPCVIAHCSQAGWGLVNCNESQLASYAVRLADEVLMAVESLKPYAPTGGQQ